MEEIRKLEKALAEYRAKKVLRAFSYYTMFLMVWGIPLLAMAIFMCW